MRRKARRWCFSATALLDQFEEGVVATYIGQQLGVQRGTIQRWRDQETFLDPYSADQFAVKLGKHPSQIWTNWFDLPELSPKQRIKILKENNPCQQTNVTASVTTRSAKNTDAGDTTSRRSTSTSSSSNTTKPKPKRSSNTVTPTARSAKTRASKQSRT